MFLAYLLAGIDIEYVAWTSSFSDIVNSFKEVEIDEIKDWDEYFHEKRKFINDDFLKDYKK